MGFEQTTFGEFAKVQGGYAYKSKDFIEHSSNKVLKIKNVRFGTVNYIDSGYISDELAQLTQAWQANEGDILISMTGSGPNAPQSLVGRVARVWANEPNAWINQRVGRIQLKKKDIIHLDFLFYLLSLPQSQEFLVSNSSGSANQANISGKIIELLPCPKVNFNQSKYIADIARSLDEKIILNKQINQTLEQMAQTLFKSWFVDFDPVFDNLLAKVDFKLENLATDFPELLLKRAKIRLFSLDDKAKTALTFTLKQGEQSADSPAPLFKGTAKEIAEQAQANIHKHFPSEFEHNEQLGWIPKGWETCSLGDKVVVKRGGSPRPIKDFIAPEGLAWTKISDATASQSRFIKKTKEYIKPEGLKKTTLLKKGTLILSNSATPGLPKFLDLDACIHDGWLHFPEKEIFSDLYLYQLFLVVRKELVQQGNGSVFTNLKTDILKNHNLVVPSEAVLNMFDDYMKHMAHKIHAISENTATIEKLRDTLLPKLISGDLEIPDAKASNEKTA